MSHPMSVYIPMDRRHALAQGATLPERASGAVLFADISGFTPLTEVLVRTLGARRGAEELTRQLNLVYDALIAEVNHYGGSVIGFAGDAITCWFAGEAGARRQEETQDIEGQALASLRATACAMACQRAMQQFASVALPSGDTVALAMKAAVASGSARRFLVGDPKIQLIDALVGETMARMAAAEHHADRGEIVVDAQTAALLGDGVQVREKIETGDRDREGEEERFFVVGELLGDVELAPWPPLPQEALDETQVRPWLLPVIYERLREGLGEFMTELRPAAALFMRFGGIDYDGDEDAGAKLDAYIRWVQGVVRLYGGTLLQLIVGDKGSYLYGAFGAPIAHEDDARRAVTAALELHAPPPELDFVGQVQIGISQGTMRTGAYGGRARRTYGVLGDEVNMAARLMQRASPGEALVSQGVQKATASAFVWEALPPVQLKGKSKPVPVARLAGSRQVLHTAFHGLPFEAGGLMEVFFLEKELVGREGELAQMLQILERVLVGEGRILQLEGGMGMGKSHLAAKFAVEAINHGARVCLGACQSTTQHIPYAPWREVFRTLLALDDGDTSKEEPASQGEALPAGEGKAIADARQIARLEALVDQLNPDWRIRLPLLGDLLDLPIPDNATTVAFDPRLRQEALFALAVELVQAYSRDQPLLLLIEDAHWIDEASQGLALALGRVVAKSPALLMLVQRPPTHEDKALLPGLNQQPGYHQLSLGELSPDEIAALVTNRLQASPSPGIKEGEVYPEQGRRDEVSALAISLIQAKAQGHPFFAEELVDALREAEDLVHQDGEWVLSDTLVNSLHEANCLAKDPASGEWVLCPDAQLSAVSIGIPDSVHATVLSRLDRLPEQHKLTLKAASVIGRVFELEVLARAHPARPGREVLQAQLEMLERRGFAQLETLPPRAAYIFKHNVTQEVVYETLLEAQQRKLHRAVGPVLEMFQPEAVEQLAYHFNRSDVRYKTLFYLDKAARKAQRNYANETALNYYSQALAMEELWEWRKGQIEILHILGRREEEQAALRALEVMPDVPAYEVAHLWGQHYEAVSDYTQAQVVVERALAISREWANRLGEINSLAQLGLIARRQGDYERAKSWYRQALASFQESEHHSPEEATAFAQAFNGLGIVHRQQGNFDEAKACYKQALTLSRQSSNRKGEAEALNSLGVTARYQRHFTEALSYHQQALEVHQAIGDRAGEGESLSNLAGVVIEAGDYGPASGYLSAALTIQQAIGNRWEEINIRMARGVLYQELGDFSKAEDCLQRGLKLAQEVGDEVGVAYLLDNLGLVSYNSGNFVLSEKQQTSGIAIARKYNERHLVTNFLYHMSMTSLKLGMLEQAMEQAQTSLSLRQELGMRLSTAGDLAMLAAIHLTAKDVPLALDYAEQSLALLEECGGEGPEFPQQDYFICHQVLAATGQVERAQAALRSAYDLVIARADKITDPGLRQSFLENVPTNKQIVEEAKRVLGPIM